jgi:O-antigen/teichoic acid export membrane protein
VGALLGVGLMPVLVPPLFGPAYAAAVPACQLLAVAGPLLVANRLGVAVLLGRGRFRLATLHALLRALAVPGGLWLAWRVGRMDAVTGAAAGWLLAEAAGVLALAWIWRGLRVRPGEAG